MPDPISQAVSDALDSVNPIENTTAAAANDDAAANGAGADDGANGAGNDDGAGAAAGAGSDDGQGGDDNGAAAGSDDAGAGDGGAELDLTEVIAKDAAELTDDEKAFIVENQDDLTGKQVKAYKEAGIDFDGTGDDDSAAGAGSDDGEGAAAAATETPKLHEIPDNDDDLVVKVQDAEGEEHVFTSIDDIPEDFQFKDSRQVVQIANALSELATKRAERANLRAENEQITHSVETKNNVTKMWQGELAELQKEGIIPAGQADFLNGKFGSAKIKEAVDGLFNYMIELNQKRQALGQPLLSSLRDVQHYRAADQAAAAAAAKDKHAKDVKTEKGKVVAASNTSTASSSKSKDEPTYVRGSGATIQSITEDAIAQVSK